MYFIGDRAQQAKQSIDPAPEEKAHPGVECDERRYPDSDADPWD